MDAKEFNRRVPFRPNRVTSVKSHTSLQNFKFHHDATNVAGYHLRNYYHENILNTHSRPTKVLTWNISDYVNKTKFISVYFEPDN